MAEGQLLGQLWGAVIQIRRNLSSFPDWCDRRLASSVTADVGRGTWLGFQEPLC